MTSPVPPKPAHLKLEFSKAADAGRIGRLFDPTVKDPADPRHFVDKRLPAVFKKAVDSGCAALLSDDAGNVQVMTIAYHLSAAPEKPDAHDYTEFGSTLSLIQGYNSSVPVIAALALREWFTHPPAAKIAAEIRRDNIPSTKVCSEKLGWEVITNKAEYDTITAASWHTVPDEKADPTGLTGMTTVPADANDMNWYVCSAAALKQQAKAVLEAMDRGGLVNSKTGDFIPVDFSALEKEGLTRKRLEAIAHGVTSRAALGKIRP